MLPLRSPLGPTIETARLILRPPVVEDFEGFCEFHSDKDAMKHLGGTLSDPVVWRVMRSIAGAWALDGFHMFSVIDKAKGEWLGRIGPLYPHAWPAREVGWGLISRYWGKGYAIEAAVAAMDFVVNDLGWDDVIHTIAPDNAGSSAVARKLGAFNRGPGRLPDPYADHVVDNWGQTAAQWRINRLKLIEN